MSMQPSKTGRTLESYGPSAFRLREKEREREKRGDFIFFWFFIRGREFSKNIAGGVSLPLARRGSHRLCELLAIKVTESGRRTRKEREEKRRGGEKSEKKKRKKTTGGKKVKNSHQHVAPHFEHVSGVPRHEDAEAHHRRSHHPHGDGMVLVAFPPGLVGDAGDALSWSFFF